MEERVITTEELPSDSFEETLRPQVLDNLNGVSINMAKNQNLALNPEKINGVCGRLMCCLAYENESYFEYKKDLPRVGEVIEIEFTKKTNLIFLFTILKSELETEKIAFMIWNCIIERLIL